MDRWSCGVIDGALEFDGINDYVEDADGEDYINGLTAFTISVWIQSDTIGTNRGIILGEVPSNDDVFSLRHDALGKYGGGTNGINAGFRVSGNDQQIESSANVQTTGWQHLAVTWSSGNQLALYIDGRIDSPRYNDIAQTGSISGLETLFIGRGPKSSADVWDGRIDDIRIYDYALDPTEIAELADILRYREFTEAKAVSDTTSLTISTPYGVQEDDLLIAAVATDGDTESSLSPPGGQGWTEIDIDEQSAKVTLLTFA